MERRLALWLGVPFLGVAWSLIAFVALMPGRINSRLVMALLLVLSVAGVVLLLLRIVARHRAGSSLIDTLYPIIGILVALGVAFHGQVGTAGRAILDNLAPGGVMTADGMRFARADDGQFHIRLMVEGSAVDFMVDVGTPFNVLMPDVPKRIGINPSSLIYDQRLELAMGRTEYAADVVLPKVHLGSRTIENLPFKVLATDRFRNVLGKMFFERFKSWRIDGDTLIIVP